MLIKNKSFKPFVGPRKISTVTPPRLPQAEKTVTDWAYFSKFVKSKGELGHRQYAAWTTRRGSMTEVIRAGFKTFKHEFLYEITVSHIMETVRRSEHSLGKLDIKVLKKYPRYNKVADWSPNVPFVYLFHTMLERDQKIPTWQDAWRKFDGELSEFCWQPFCTSFHIDPNLSIEDLRKLDPLLVDSFQWRMGAAYYSFIREVHFLASMRQLHDLDIKYHFALDTEWKIDFLAGDVLIALYIENIDYKTAKEGRKKKCIEMNPRYEILDLIIENQKIPGGKPYLIPTTEIAANARKLLAAGCPTISSHAKAA